MPSAAALQIIDKPRSALTLLHPERLRILENLHQPDSASGLSRRLDVPRQKIDYHLRELESTGIVEFVEERRKGDCMERVMSPAAESFLLSPDTLGSLAPNPVNIRDRFSAAYLLARAAQAIRDLTGLRRRPRRQDPRHTSETEIRFRSAEERKQFTNELTANLAKLTAKYHDEHAPGGRRFQFFLAGYPAVTSTKEEPKSNPGKAAACSSPGDLAPRVQPASRNGNPANSSASQCRRHRAR